MNEWSELEVRRTREGHRSYLKMFGMLTAIIGLTILINSIVVTFCQAQVVIDLNVIAHIESSNGKFKIHSDGLSLGKHGVGKGALADFNQDHNNKYTYQQLMNDEISEEVAEYYVNVRIPRYLRSYKIPDTVKHRIIAYNMGIGKLKKWYRSGADESKLPTITKKYYSDKYPRYARQK